jgi:hypothetical protein
MAPAWIAEMLDVVEHIFPGRIPGAVNASIDRSVFWGIKKLSIAEYPSNRLGDSCRK